MPWPIVPAPRTATVFTSTGEGTVARSAEAFAVVSGVVSSRGVVKKVSAPTRREGSGRARLFGQIRLRLRKKLYYTRREKGYRESARAGARRRARRRRVARSNPAYRQPTRRGLK